MITRQKSNSPLIREPALLDQAQPEEPSLSTPPADDGNWWMITLSDLTLLILGFTVAWYLAGSAAIARRTESAKINPPAGETAGTAAPKAMLETVPWQTVQRQIESFVAAAKLTDDVVIESAPYEITLSLRDTVPFASAKADLRPRALPILEKIAAIILSNSRLSVEISGHSDSLRIATAEFPSNWELSAARASRVARYLVERGVQPSRISVQGYADLRPRNSNATALSRRANRRVEIRLFHDAGADEKISLDTPSR
jgi:chemotaxis protein MotB